jgi:hypothetical protein
MTPRTKSRFKRGRAAASETEKRRDGPQAVPAFQFVKKLCFSAQLLYERSLRAHPLFFLRRAFCLAKPHGFTTAGCFPGRLFHFYVYALFNAAKHLRSLHASGGICSVLFDKGMG